MLCQKCKSLLPEGANFCPNCGKKLTAAPRKARKRANGTGCISHLSGNRAKPWAARKNGVLIGTYQYRADAVKALERLTESSITDKYNWTFKQIYEAWKPEHDRTISVHGQGSYKFAFNNCKELHDLKFRSIRRSDFQSVIIRLEQEGKSKSTCEKMLQLFGQLSDWAIQEELIQVNRARYCTIVAEQKSNGLVFPDEAIEKLKKSEAPAAQIALILLATGCRPNELFQTATKDCTPDYFIGGSKTDAGKNRVIAVSQLGQEAYRSLLAAAQGHPKLIDGYNGPNHTYANFAKREWKQLMEELGTPAYTPYDCRHTFITKATKSGIDPQLLRRMVGHADLSTTDKFYTHLDTADILKAISQKEIFPHGLEQICNKENQR